MCPRKPKGFRMCAQNWSFMCAYVFNLSIHQELHLSWRYRPSFIYLQWGWSLNWSLFQSCTEGKNCKKQFGAKIHPVSERKVVLHRALEPCSSDLLLENDIKFIGNPESIFRQRWTFCQFKSWDETCCKLSRLYLTLKDYIVVNFKVMKYIKVAALRITKL